MERRFGIGRCAHCARVVRRVVVPNGAELESEALRPHCGQMAGGRRRGGSDAKSETCRGAPSTRTQARATDIELECSRKTDYASSVRAPAGTAPLPERRELSREGRD